jgi:histone deacetylase 1/2
MIPTLTFPTSPIHFRPPPTLLTATLPHSCRIDPLMNIFSISFQNYLKLRKFGCLCYPLTRSYNTNKLQPKSRPCVFLGYSQTQNAYKCMDATTNRLFLSRHVLFDENRHVPPIPPDVSSHYLLPSVSSPFVPVPCSPSVTVSSHQSPSST